jgi:N-acetylglucosamine malate deacetylase 1
MNILVIAAHPDDEVLGMGATIKKLSKNFKVDLCVVSEGASAQYSDSKMIDVRKQSCIKSGKILGISNFYFLEFPDMKLDSIPQIEITKKLESILKKKKYSAIYTTPSNDLNKDHRIVYESTIIAARPSRNKVRKILSYEIPGHVVTPFVPNVYENIFKEFLFKKKAFEKYSSEIEKFPNPRSFEVLESLAKLRGMESGFKKAESFQLIRSISI